MIVRKKAGNCAIKMVKESERSSAFEERKELIRLQMEADKIKHCFKMEELDYERASNKINHEHILERGRIQRAEERRMIAERRDSYRR